MKEMFYYKLDILGMSEVQWTGSGTINSRGVTIILSAHQNHHIICRVRICMKNSVAEAMIG